MTIDSTEMVVYEVELDRPSYYVEVVAPAGLSHREVLDLAIEEMIERTRILTLRTREL